jgi:predicted acyl esterase
MDRSASSIKLIAAGRPKRKRPGHRLRAQFQSSNFGTHTRVAESGQHKNENDFFFPAIIVFARPFA